MIALSVREDSRKSIDRIVGSRREQEKHHRIVGSAVVFSRMTLPELILRLGGERRFSATIALVTPASLYL